MKKYRVRNKNLVTIGQGDFVIAVEGDVIELPEELGQVLVLTGDLTQLDTEYLEMQSGGLHNPQQRKTRARKQSNSG